MRPVRTRERFGYDNGRMPSAVFPGASQPEVPASLVEQLGSPALPSPLREIEEAAFARRGVRLLLKRDDLVHPEISENRPTGVGGR